MLVNDVSLRNLIPAELAKGFGFLQSKPATAFSPVAVTPDELGDAWHDGKVHLPLVSHLNGALFGRPNAGVDMTFDFRDADRACREDARARSRHASSARAPCRTRKPADRAVRRRPAASATRASPSSARSRRSSTGGRVTPFMRFGDRVRIEMLGRDGASIFGAIDQVGRANTRHVR